MLLVSSPSAPCAEHPASGILEVHVCEQVGSFSLPLILGFQAYSTGELRPHYTLVAHLTCLSRMFYMLLFRTSNLRTGSCARTPIIRLLGRQTSSQLVRQSKQAGALPRLMTNQIHCKSMCSSDPSSATCLLGQPSRTSSKMHQFPAYASVLFERSSRTSFATTRPPVKRSLSFVIAVAGAFVPKQACCLGLQEVSHADRATTSTCTMR